MNSSLPWYCDGLRFECTGCGGCCTGFPGYVWVTEEEIATMASYLKLSLQAFSDAYLRKVGGRYSLRERPHDHACLFLEGKRCGIYPARPRQCRTFPFWPQTLATPETWAETARYCEGIHPNAPKISLEEIEKHAYPQS